MILSDIKAYLQQHGKATLADLSNHFDTPPDAVRGMLDIWIRKGKIGKKSTNVACGSRCNQCDQAATETYYWKDTAIYHKKQRWPIADLEFRLDDKSINWL